MKLRKIIYIFAVSTFLLWGFAPSSFALVFPLPSLTNDVVGAVKIIQSKKGDNLFKIARRYEMGYDDVKQANKRLARRGWFKKGTPIIIPSYFILPDAPRVGIVINIPEKRLYLYPKNENIVITEPVAVGIYGWPTPLLDGHILEKMKNPTWHIPESIQAERSYEGKPNVTFIPPGPKNPLGKYAIRLSNRVILIHSTIALNSIGRRASHGCIRMYPEDAEHIFYSVKAHMPVRVINQPFKAGWKNHQLYLEIHPTLIENRGSIHKRVAEAYNLLLSKTNGNKSIINWSNVEATLVKQNGIPKMISKQIQESY